MKVTHAVIRLGGHIGRRVLGDSFPPVQRAFERALIATTAATRRAAMRVAPRSYFRRQEEREDGQWAARSRALEPTKRFVAAHGLVVRGGPFAGLRYVPGAVRHKVLVPRLLGVYERQLHSTLEELIATRPVRVVNVGAADGYYAVGMAMRLPEAVVDAFEIDPWEQDRCRALAEANGVADRVVIHGACEPDDLHVRVGPRTVVLCDCEGCEVDVLDLERVPKLAATHLVVELHDILRDGVTPTLSRRFAATHDMRVLDLEVADPADHPELAAMPAPERPLVLDEGRPPGIRWAVFTPRSAT